MLLSSLKLAAVNMSFINSPVVNNAEFMISHIGAIGFFALEISGFHHLFHWHHIHLVWDLPFNEAVTLMKQLSSLPAYRNGEIMTDEGNLEF